MINLSTTSVANAFFKPDDWKSSFTNTLPINNNLTKTLNSSIDKFNTMAGVSIENRGLFISNFLKQFFLSNSVLIIFIKFSL